MQTAKQEVEAMLHHLPEDSTLEDIQYHFMYWRKSKKAEKASPMVGVVAKKKQGLA